MLNAHLPFDSLEGMPRIQLFSDVLLIPFHSSLGLEQGSVLTATFTMFNVFVCITSLSLFFLSLDCATFFCHANRGQVLNGRGEGHRSFKSL